MTSELNFGRSGHGRVEELGARVVIGFAAARQALESPALSPEWLELPTPFHEGPRRLKSWGLGDWLIFAHGEHHQRLRAALTPLFFARNGASAETIDAIVGAEFQRRVESNPVDIAGDLAPVVAGEVVCKLTGIDRAAAQNFRRWTLAVGDVLRRDYLPPVADAGRCALDEMDAAAEDAFDNATDAGCAGVLLRTATDDGMLSRREAIALIAFMIYAAFATTVPFLANAVYEVLTQDKLHQCSNRRSTSQLVEELLRLYTSVPQTARVAVDRCVIEGSPIEAGELVLIRMADANRDESVFGPTNEIDQIGATHARALTFGAGVHYCLGAGVARHVAAAVLENAHRDWRNPSINLDTLHVSGNDPRTFARLDVLREMSVRPW